MPELACPVTAVDETRVLLAHGGGGRLTRRLVERLMLPALENPALAALLDGAILEKVDGRLAFSTDGFVVQPLFFPGGDIGSLAVYGTVNDLAMCGARALALSLGLILEEGLPMDQPERVVASVAAAARAAGVRVVTGDTKVVERGKGDGVFIHTSGIGVLRAGAPAGPASVREGDGVLVSGPVGQHGIAVLAVRDGIAFDAPILSDCGCVAPAVHALLDAGIDVRCLRDPTRGGVATALNEIAQQAKVTVVLDESRIPVSEEVAGACEILGLDPLYVACEGRFLAVVAAGDLDRAVALLRSRPDTARAAAIGRVRAADLAGPMVAMTTLLGAERVLDPLSGEQLPRIC